MKQNTGLLILIIIMVVVYSIWIGESTKRHHEEIRDLENDIIDLQANLSRMTVYRDICENDLNVVIQEKYGSINWDKKVCEEFC